MWRRSSDCVLEGEREIRGVEWRKKESAWYFGVNIPASGTQAARSAGLFRQHSHLSQAVFFSVDYKTVSQ
jgi:hypothetical protein